MSISSFTIKIGILYYIFLSQRLLFKGHYEILQPSVGIYCSQNVIQEIGQTLHIFRLTFFHPLPYLTPCVYDFLGFQSSMKSKCSILQ